MGTRPSLARAVTVFLVVLTLRVQMFAGRTHRLITVLLHFTPETHIWLLYSLTGC
jgi:hypothetical protein